MDGINDRSIQTLLREKTTRGKRLKFRLKSELHMQSCCFAWQQYLGMDKFKVQRYSTRLWEQSQMEGSICQVIGGVTTVITDYGIGGLQV